MKLILTSFIFILLTQPLYAKTYSKVFAGSPDLIWKGLLISLAKYPLDVHNQEQGLIETSKISGGTIWTPYNETLSDKIQYTIKIYVNSLPNRSGLIKVSIEKEVTQKGDFMTEPKELTSSGLEETVILYRISREIYIDRVIEKLFNK